MNLIMQAGLVNSQWYPDVLLIGKVQVKDIHMRQHYTHVPVNMYAC
jgi:hypothetical protein